jgi:hypothetical protein
MVEQCFSWHRGGGARQDAELVEQSLAYEDLRGVLTLLCTVDD